jgi:hypothetical protein
MPAIESNDLSIGDVLKDFYAVPDYQREYVWKEDQVEQLLADIRSEQSSDPIAEYFVGSIVTCESKGGRFDLIDGQQRMTTLFVILCAFRDRLIELGHSPGAAVNNLLATEKIDLSGQGSHEIRLDLQYEDAGELLQHLFLDNLPVPKNMTRSMENIKIAYDTATDFYRKEFGGDVIALRAFFGYLINKVKLIRVRTDSIARALKIFETINDRGVGLDAMDLLKNLLFMKSKDQEFDRLKKLWKSLVDSLHAAGEKPLRFLRYVVFATYGEQKLREDELYGWLVRNESKVGFGSNPLKFVTMLNEAVDAYLKFMNGLGPDGRPHPDTEALQILAGKATRQHLILLLAGRNLPSDIFAALCKDTERLLFVYLITRQNNREFEVLFPEWAVQLSELKSLEEYRIFSARTFDKKRADLSDRFVREFSNLDVSGLKKFQQRYIVCKLTQAVDLSAFGASSEGHKWLSRYCDGNASHIEHITPQTPDDDVRTEFGDGVDDHRVIWSIGNLALAEAAINHSLGRKPYAAALGLYSDKRPLKAEVYPNSQYLLTRSISKKVEIGRNTAIDRAVSDFEPFLSWNNKEVSRRTEMLTKLAIKVWQVERTASPTETQ